LRTSLSVTKNGHIEKTPSPPPTADLPVDSPFTPHYLETEFDHERVGVTIWDSQGLEKKFVDLQLREMSSFLESKFEETFTEEQKVIRAPGVRDTHIHCVFLILDPSRLDSNLAHAKRLGQPQSARFEEHLRLMGILDEDLDVQVLRTLQGKTTVIPVISKADTITTNHMGMLKRAVWDSLKKAKLDPLEALSFEDSESEDVRLDERDEDALLNEETMSNDSIDLDDMLDELDHPTELKPAVNRPNHSHRRTPSGLGSRLSHAERSTADNDTPYLPMSILSPDTYEPGIVGRRFPWGFADPYNPDHCDFVRLKESVFAEWRAELREASREVWYEGWRTSRLNRRTAHGITTSATKSATNGRHRNVSANLPPSKNYSGTSPYAGGPVGQASNSAPAMYNGTNGGAYNNGHHQKPPSAAPAVHLPNPHHSEMQGVYQNGVNAF
jgi:septin family protein